VTPRSDCVGECRDEHCSSVCHRLLRSRCGGVRSPRPTAMPRNICRWEIIRRRGAPACAPSGRCGHRPLQGVVQKLPPTRRGRVSRSVNHGRHRLHRRRGGFHIRPRAHTGCVPTPFIVMRWVICGTMWASSPTIQKTACAFITQAVFYQSSSSSFSTAIKASVGICTVPRLLMRFLPSFCFSSSFFFRVISPP